MVQRVYEQALQVFDHVVVATDDERIARAVRQFGGCVAMTSTQHRTGTDRCAEAIDIVENEQQQHFDVVVNVQGDEPFIAPAQLAQLKNCFADEEVQLATLVKIFGRNEDIFSPNSPKVAGGVDGYALYFSRSAIPFLRGREREQWPEVFPFYKHVGLYAYRTNVLRRLARLPQTPLEQAESLEQLRWLEHGYRIKVAITDFETYAIDTPEDLERVRGRFMG
jgi:3-deoxy-manno-octulosonate cytidylyltransferase (CMP-KDO synthetase)